MGQALVMLTTPIVSRLYTDSDMGGFGLFLSFLSVASVVATARYELAIPGAPTDAEADALLFASLSLAVPLSMLGVALLWWFIATNAFGYGVLSPWAVALALPSLLAFAAFGALRYWYVRARRFELIGGVLVVQGVGRALTPVAVAPLHWGAAGLIAGELVGRSLGVARMLRGARPALHRVRVSVVADSMRTHWKFPAVMLPSGLLDVLTIALPVPLIAASYGTATAGLFLLVQRLTTVPAGLVGTGIGDVFHLGVSEDVNRKGGEAVRRLDETAKRLLAAGMLVMAPAALLAPWALPPILGPGWSGAGKLFAIVAPWSLASLVIVPLSRILLVVDRKEYKFIYDLLALATLVGALAVGPIAGWSFERTMFVVSAGQCLSYAVYFALLRRACAQGLVS